MTERALVEPAHRVECRLDALLEERGMTVTELARRVEVTVANLSVLKNNRPERSASPP